MNGQPPAFQVYAGLLFGLPLAVTSFKSIQSACGSPWAAFVLRLSLALL